jgi:Zn-dependent protease with chaperone function
MDASTRGTLQGWLVIRFFTGLEPSAISVGTMQVLLLVGLATSIGVWRVQSVKSRLKLLPLSEVDTKLSEEAEYLGKHMAGGRPHFVVSNNILDLNAFCLFSHQQPLVVLGGGLRLLVRKQKKQALAVVAHECAHVNEGDTTYLLMAWYMFLSYSTLVFSSLVLSQIAFWTDFAKLYPSYVAQGNDLIDSMWMNLSPFLRNGIPGLVSVIGVWIGLVHFIRLREYRADEAAAIAGHRAALSDSLGSRRREVAVGLARLLGRFHPSLIFRAQRLKAELGWAKLDWLFVAAMSLIVVRIDLLLATFKKQNSTPTSMASSATNFMETELQSTFDNPWQWTSIFVDVLFAFAVALHLARITATQYKLCWPLFRRLQLIAPALTATFCGYFFGTLTTWKSIASLGEGRWSPVQYLDFSLSYSVININFIFFMMTAVVLVTPRFLHGNAIKATRGAFSLFIRCCIGAFVLQVIASLGWSIANFELGINYPAIQLDSFPIFSMQPFPGAPSALTMALTVVAILSTLRISAALFGKKVAESGAMTKIHTSRLVHEPGR